MICINDSKFIIGFLENIARSKAPRKYVKDEHDEYVSNKMNISINKRRFEVCYDIYYYSKLGIIVLQHLHSISIVPILHCIAK